MIGRGTEIEILTKVFFSNSNKEVVIEPMYNSKVE